MVTMCPDERARLDAAGDTWMRNAQETVGAAEAYRDETSLLDESTWLDGLLIVGMVGTCLMPATWTVCGFGIGGMVGGAALSEQDRWAEINAAEGALNQEASERDDAELEFYFRLEELTKCQAHYIAKVLRENP